MFTRFAESQDAEAIDALLKAAFQGDDEARLVQDLRRCHQVSLEWVAEEGGSVVGHVLYSPVTIENREGVGLAPVAVAPSHQKKGFGARLIRESLNVLKKRGVSFGVVLGDPAYYGRFGFRPGEVFGVGCEFDAPSGAFQVLPLATPEVSAGLARYAGAFDRFKKEGSQ